MDPHVFNRGVHPTEQLWVVHFLLNLSDLFSRKPGLVFNATVVEKGVPCKNGKTLSLMRADDHNNKGTTRASGESMQNAMAMFQRGEYQTAAKLCRLILSRDSEDSSAWHLLGLVAYQQQAYTEAEQYLNKAIALMDSNAAYHCDLGTLYLSKKNHPKALACFCRAIHLRPDLSVAHNNGGLALMAMARLTEAQQWFETALRINPGFIDAQINLGLAHNAAKHYEDAENAYKAALKLDPNNAKAYFGLGDVYHAVKELDEAIRCFQKAVQIKTDYIKAYNRLAQSLAEAERIDESIFWMSRAVRLAPRDSESYCNYGNMLRLAGMFPQAAGMYRKAIAINPEYAEAHFNLSVVLLLMGEFAQGWPEFEWRLRQFPPDSGYPNRHGLPLWQGESLIGKTILIYDEQGFGDVFLFIRFLPELKAAGARIVLETRATLIRLLRQLPHVQEVVVRHKDVRPQTRCDYCLPLASLPGRLGITVDTIAAKVPYLHPDSRDTARWARRMVKGSFKIGLVWSGSDIDPNRRMDLSLLAPLADIEDIGIYGLQKYPETSPAPPFPEAPPWVDNLGPELDDFTDTAAVIANCDLIISIDTAVAHLAGAMGRPVWVLLPHLPDWRWFTDREDSPWYPSMRLFRQYQAGQWTLPVCRVLVAIKQGIEQLRSPAVHSPIHEHRDSAEELFQRAVELQQAGQVQQAVETYHQAIDADDTLMECHYNLGLLYYRQKQWSKAAEGFRAALASAPDAAHAAYNLALAYDQAGLPQAAMAAYRQAMALNPNYMEAAYNLGLLLFQQKAFTAAHKAMLRVVEKIPDHYMAFNNLGMTCHHMGRLDDAIRAYESAIRIKTDYVEALQNLGNVYMDLGQWERMFFYYHKALNHNRHDPQAHYAMGKLYMEHLDMAQARHHFEQALALAPDNADVHFDLAMVHLCQGRLLQGWREMDWRFKQAQSRVRVYPHQLDLPVWDGAPFRASTLLVHCEQGLGDTIQFARFLPMIKSLGGKVVFQVQPALMPLFDSFPGVDRIVALADTPPDTSSIDMAVALLSVPHCLQITADRIPNALPYLSADPEKAKTWQRRVDPQRFNIGMVWSGSPMHKNDRHRSCRVEHFLTLNDLAGIQLFSLQKGVPPSQFEKQFADHGVIHWADGFDSFADTAAAVTQLDLVITVDTAVAHLAGALGCAVWIVLPYLADWRWGLHGSENVWYPGITLFRQQTDRSWGPVFERVRNALSETVRSKNKKHRHSGAD